MVLLASGDFRDRTSEFSESVARLRRQNQGGASAPLQTQQTGGRAEPSSRTRGDAAQGGAAALPHHPHPHQQQQQQQSEFSRRAAAIGRSVHEASSKVAQLRSLTKQSTVFNDPSEEIERLTRVVKQDVQDISGAVSALQGVAEAEGAAGSRQSSTHSSTVVESLRARLRDAAKEFKEVLTARTDSLRVQQSRREMYSAAPPMFAAPGSSSSLGGGPPPMMPTSSGLGGQVPVLRRRTAATSAHELFGGAGAGTQVGAAGGHFQQQQQQQLFAPQQSARAEELRNVESAIVELGGIFTQMASMVQEQGEAMLRIDENIEDTLGNVEGAQAYMLKYMNVVSSNRGLILKILAALVFMIFLFAVFVL